MKKRKKIKYIHEGHYVAEVEVELLEDESLWVRSIRTPGAFKRAAQYGQI